MSRSLFCGGNALNPCHMKPLERRAELCRILALGLIRLHMRNAGQVSAKDGEFLLHNSTDQSAHVTTSKRRRA